MRNKPVSWTDPAEAAVLNGITVRLIRPEEQVRWDQLVSQRHYLKSANLVGERLCYVAEYQRQPLTPILHHVTQLLPHQMGVLEIMMLADLAFPARLLVRLDQPHHDLIQHRGFRPVRKLDWLVSHPNEQSKSNRQCPVSSLTPSLITPNEAGQNYPGQVLTARFSPCQTRRFA